MIQDVSKSSMPSLHRWRRAIPTLGTTSPLWRAPRIATRQWIYQEKGTLGGEKWFNLGQIINHPPVITIFIGDMWLPFPVMGCLFSIVLPTWSVFFLGVGHPNVWSLTVLACRWDLDPLSAGFFETSLGGFMAFPLEMGAPLNNHPFINGNPIYKWINGWFIMENPIYKWKIIIIIHL